MINLVSNLVNYQIERKVEEALDVEGVLNSLEVQFLKKSVGEVGGGGEEEEEKE